MLSKDDRGLILIDILIVILIAGIIAVIVVPQYVQKKEKEQRELSRQNMIVLANAQDTYLRERGRYAPDIAELSSVVPEVGDISSPEGEEYTIELPDSLSYILISFLGHGEIRADTTERRLSWEN